MPLDPETRRPITVIAIIAAALLVIGIAFSGRPGDAIYDGPPIVAESVVDATELGDEVAGAQLDATDTTASPDVLTEGQVEAAEAVEEATGGEAGTPDAAEVEAATDEAEGVVIDETAAASPAPADPPAADETAADAPAETTVESEAAEQTAEEGEAAAPTEQIAEEPTESEVALAGDPAAGERVFRQCQACHQAGEGAQNRVGPHLTGIVGRPAAEVEGFNYSAAMQAAADDGLVWTPEALAGFLADPRGYMQGTSMIFAGLRSDEAIADVTAYLASAE